MSAGYQRGIRARNSTIQNNTIIHHEYWCPELISKLQQILFKTLIQTETRWKREMIWCHDFPSCYSGLLPAAAGLK